MKTFGKILLRLYVAEFAIFGLLCAIAVIKGVVVSWSGHTLSDCLQYSIGPIFIPMFLVLLHFLFCATFTNWIRILSTVFFMPWILMFTALVTIPSSGDIPPKSFSSLSQPEKIDVIKSDVQLTWEKAKANPNSPEAEMVRNWEMWNHNPDGSNRKYESQFAELDKEKSDFISKKEAEEKSRSTRLKILNWMFPG